MAKPARFLLWHRALRERSRLPWLSAPLAVVAVLLALVWSPWAGGLCALLGGGGLWLWRRRSSRRLGAGALSWHDGTLRRSQGDLEAQGELLVSRGELLGLTLLVSASEEPEVEQCVRLVLTTPSRVRVLPVAIESADELAALSKLVTPIRDGSVPSTGPALLCKDAIELVHALCLQFPHSTERLYLRGARGEAITLDRTELQVGAHRYGLERPFELRAFAFLEHGGHLVGSYQAVWLKQLQDGDPPGWDPVLPALRAAQECVFVAGVDSSEGAPSTLPLLDTAEATVLLRAPKHAIDGFLFSTLYHRLKLAVQTGRAPQSRRFRSAPLGSQHD